MKDLIIIIFVSFFLASKAFSWCSEPMAPSAPSSWSKPTKPSVPYCVNEWSNTHTCDDWTINSYNSDVDYYNSQLQSYRYDVDNYVRELQNFANEAAAYANCEIRNLN